MGPYIHFKMYKEVNFVLSFTVIAIYGFKLEANEPSTRKEGCTVPSWRGDNYCDDGNNNEGCDYDGGDCCGSNVNKTYCQNCECLDPNNGGPIKCVKVENGIKTETTTKFTPDGSGTCSISFITFTTNLNTGTGWGKGSTAAKAPCNHKAYKCD